MAFKGYLTIINVWGCSSIGRAPALQAGGRRFDPVWLHQISVSIDVNPHVPRLMDAAAPRVLFSR